MVESTVNYIMASIRKSSLIDGLLRRDIPEYPEEAVREAVLNAVSHRDYRHGGSVFVRQYPRRIEIVSPGGFPPGISVENIIDRQSPRNRRIVDNFARCGLVERAGIRQHAGDINAVVEDAVARLLGAIDGR